MAARATSSAPRSPGSARHHPRRKSAQERIEDILEGARERAESLDQSSANVSPRLRPLLGGPPSPRRENGHHTSSAGLPEEVDDEHGLETGQPPRQQSLNYQSTAQTGPVQRRRTGQKQGRPPSQTGSGAGGNGQGRQPRGRQEESRWKRTLRYFQSIELENKGSVARDHLALERTFLAWLRTSLAFASIGIAITQLFRLNTTLDGDTRQAETLRRLGKPLGTAFLGISILILLLGYNRYLQGQHWVIRGKFPASRGTIMLVAFIAFAVTLAALIVILTVQSGPT